MFDAQAFLDSAVQGENSTERALIPEGEYVVEIEDIDVKPTKNPLFVNMILKTVVDHEEAAAHLGRKTNPFKYNFTTLLELDETGGLDMGEGKNIHLGQMRKALGQNNPAKPWKFSDLIGGQVMIQLVHEQQKDSDRVNERIRRIVSI